MLHQKTSNNM